MGRDKIYQLFQILMLSDDYIQKNMNYHYLQCQILFSQKYQSPTENMSLTKLEQQPQSSRQNYINIEAVYQELTLTEDPQKITDLKHAILSYIKTVDGRQLETALQLILKIFSKGYSDLFAEFPQIIIKIMDLFVVLSKYFKKQPSYQMKYRLFFILSILAEFVRQKPKFELPFKRDFLVELFEIEMEDVQQEAKPKLLAILGVLLSNLCQQQLLVREMKIGKHVKEALLSNYSFIEQPFTLKLFNQSIIQLQTKKLALFSIYELERYGIKKALVKAIGEEKEQVIERYMERIFGKKQSLA